MTIRDLLPLRTDRLVLREVRDDDVDAILGYCGDPDVVRFLPFGVLDREAVLGRMQRWRDDLARDPAADVERDWAVTLVADFDGVVVGDVMMRLKAGPEMTMAELGYVFSPSVAGRGLATEAATAVVDLAFGPLGCHRVFAQLDPRNTASSRLCERIGMKHEAHLRRDYYADGEWSDTGIYGVLREEWGSR